MPATTSTLSENQKNINLDRQGLKILCIGLAKVRENIKTFPY